jgi:ribulose-5-phosphate 4-epimerase/fuculose-1-phosphate aldolase
MIDEGVIKFQCAWEEAPAIPDDEIADLIEWRNRLHAAGLIGHDSVNDVGYGNISCRTAGERQFVISATQTGNVVRASGRQFTRVVDYDIDASRIVCRGPGKASSESLTHAAIYELDPQIHAIAHVHNLQMWESLQGKAPTTDSKVAYGTPAMAEEFRRLFRATDLPMSRLAVMGGHEDGLISFGASAQEAAARLFAACGESLPH